VLGDLADYVPHGRIRFSATRKRRSEIIASMDEARRERKLRPRQAASMLGRLNFALSAACDKPRCERITRSSVVTVRVPLDPVPEVRGRVNLCPLEGIDGPCRSSFSAVETVVPGYRSLELRCTLVPVSEQIALQHGHIAEVDGIRGVSQPAARACQHLDFMISGRRKSLLNDLRAP